MAVDVRPVVVTGSRLAPAIVVQTCMACGQQVAVRRAALASVKNRGAVPRVVCHECDDLRNDSSAVTRPVNRPSGPGPVRRQPILSSC
jgi:hypothetical protein